MELIKTESKFIKTFGYDDISKVLQVEIGDKTYLHYDVPLVLFENLKASPSKGSFYNKYIRGKFTGE